MTLDGDGSGTAEVKVSLHPLMVRYIKDLSAGFGASGGTEGEENGGESAAGGGDFRAFDEAQIRRTFARIDGAQIELLALPGEGELHLKASFRRVDELLPQDGEHVPPLRFTAEGERRTLRIRLDRRNYKAIYPLLGMEEQNAVATFGPQRDPYSESEYIEMMRYALGDYASAGEIEKALRGAATTLSVTVDGKILSAEGFETEGRTATARIPYLRFATLAEPIELTLTWRPE